MEHQVYFEIDIFKKSSLENEQTSKAINLAKWLCNMLPVNLDADYLDEDWGCRIYLAEPYTSTVDVSCGFVENNSYSIAIKVKQSFIDKMLGRNKHIAEIEQLKTIFDRFLNSQADVRRVEWEFSG